MSDVCCGRKKGSDDRCPHEATIFWVFRGNFYAGCSDHCPEFNQLDEAFWEGSGPRSITWEEFVVARVLND